MITYGSVCSGIESATTAWHPLGMQAQWFAEIEPFTAAVLHHHWPNVPNLGDMTLLPSWVRAGLVPAPDVLVGGTPCQSFSVSGKGGSLADDRGKLAITYTDLLDALDEKRQQPAIALWENVPGVLSTLDNGFGYLLGKLAGSGHALQPGERPAVGKSSTFWRWNKKQGVHVARWPHSGEVSGPRRSIAWRTLDAQYLGLAQRRKRVFLVASARDGFDPGKVLFESDGLRRDSPPSREAGQVVAGGTARSVAIRGREGGATAELGGHVAAALRTGGGGSSRPFVLQVAHRMLARGLYESDDIASTMMARDYKDARDLVTVHGTQDPCVNIELAHTLGRNNGGENAVHAGDRVRRLTPTECERLMGFPDGHTLVPYRGKPATDGPRYRALGNSKAVPVVRWIGKRILEEIER